MLTRPILTSIRRAMSTTPKITLTPTESTFLHHLDTFSRHLDPPVECRIAGGWVRDKLLSLPSNDLDIALTIPSGYQFAVSFVAYLHSRSVPTGSVGIVLANPEQSKHLETGTTKILGLECDFVGLRSETYTDSRIPDQIKLGTPEQDASRRDLTINALFYNVTSRSIEDLTGRGLDDLQKKIARTPLPPLQTFHDDPLRAIRCVRFASRFNLTIEPEVADAIKQEEIKTALQAKVSKDRIGIEVSKMMKKNPLAALTLIDSLSLHSSIFTCDINPPRSSALSAAQILSRVTQVMPDDELLWFAAAVTPFAGYSTRKHPAVSTVLAHGLKRSNEIRDGVAKLFAAAPLLNPALADRSELGMVLRQVLPWRRTVAWATVMAILPDWQGVWDERAEAILKDHQQLVARIDTLNLDKAILDPPLLDGKRLQQVLNIVPSPVYTVILSEIMRWQLGHPQGTSDECAEWVSQQWNSPTRNEWEAASRSKPAGTKTEKRKRP